VPSEVQALLDQHPWAEVNRVDEDYGPGTKLLGALRWLRSHPDSWQEDDVLMILDDDHAYMPHALGELFREQLSRGQQFICSFFSYFFRGIMVPQGADIIAFQLSGKLIEDLLEFHLTFVQGDPACFLVDDLWIGMYARLAGRNTVSLRDLVMRRGLETIYKRTENSKVVALEALGGEDRRDRVTLRAFDGLLARLAAAGAEGLSRWGGDAARQRVRQLAAEVSSVERQIKDIERYIEREQANGDEDSPGVEKASEQLAKMKHLYQMQVPTNPAKRRDAAA